MDGAERFTDYEKELVLAFDPFEGDDVGADRRLRDKVVVPRRRHTCFNCSTVGEPGVEERVIVDMFEGELKEYRFCNKCCRALVDDLKAEEDEEFDPSASRYHARFEEHLKDRDARAAVEMSRAL